MNRKIERIIISGGGTGGHIFPAIAIADAIKLRYPKAKILFVGAEGRMEMERVPKAGYEIEGLAVRGLDRKRPWRNVGVLIDLGKSFLKAGRIVKNFRPDLVVGVGGYASAPTLLAAQHLGIPTLLQEQNSFAGKANKLLSRKARAVCVAYPDMQRFFKHTPPILTGNPVRPILEEMPLPQQAIARQQLGLDESNDPVVVAVGGSLGARTINKSLHLGLEKFLEAGIRLVWQTGRGYAEEAQRAVAALGDRAKGKIVVLPFIERMEAAYSAADLLISRAGASTISEITLLGKPSILVPSPNVAEDHQTHNAHALSSRGAAVFVTDANAMEELVSEALALTARPNQLEAMSRAAKALALPQSATKIVTIIEGIINPLAQQ